MEKDKIEVGEYIKLKRGDIFKIDENTANYYNSNKEFITNEIVKHSKNIIDLIEVGDIVKTGVTTIFINVMETQENLEYFKELYKNDIDAIRTIITHEQIKEMEYRVE